jgi:type IV pilus assembly protein PilA
MGSVQTFRIFCAGRVRSLVQYVFVFFMLLALAAAQTVYTGTDPNSPINDLNKYPGLFPEFGELFQKIERGIQLPPARKQSRILPLLPQATIFYLGAPNVGEASNQAWAIFQKELQNSSVLQSWWQGLPAASRTQVEDSQKKFYEFSQYLGDEVVISATREGVKDAEPVIIAEVRKPGLKEYLQQTVKELTGKTPAQVYVIDEKELASLEDKPGAQQFVILVRPDLAIGATSVAALRQFNAQLDTNAKEFASTNFGQKLTQTYQEGVTAVGGVDLQKIVSQLPKGNAKSEATFQSSGFADVKYLIWKHKSAANASSSETELSFTGPRRGLAAWLGTPAQLGSLDFVSPKAMVASAIRLNNPAQMFDDIKALSGPDSKQFDGIEQMENAMQISIKDDLLGQLDGEILFDLDSVSQEDAQWKVLLRVRDPEKFQATLSKLLGQVPFLQPQQSEEGGITYHALHIPSAKKPMEFDYAFVDGYLLIASSHSEIAEVVRLHQSGGSLAKSPKFLAALPPVHGLEASAIFYEDPAAMVAMSMAHASLGMPNALVHPSGTGTPMVLCAYGEESAIRGVSRSAGMDAGAMMVVAAIAIPNMLRAKTAADESSAIAVLRTIKTAQMVYSTSYPDVGYARNLARLGIDPKDAKATSAEHAGLIDTTLWNAGCAADKWCTKSGYKFNMSATCGYGHCQDYVVTATPVSASTGSKSFCATSQAVIHYKVDAVLQLPVSVAECRTWQPLH